MLRHLPRVSLLLLVGASFGIGAPAQATDFALLLKGGDEFGDKTVSISNPYFVSNELGGEMVPSSLFLQPNQFLGARDLLLEVNFEESLGDSVPPAPGGGYAFEINVTDAQTGVPLTQLDRPIDIELAIPGLAHLHAEGVVHRDLAMRRFDTSLSPPEWRVQDPKIMTCDTDKFCGKTDHLSVFSLGFVIPEPSALLLAAWLLTPCLCRQRRTG